MMAVGRRSTWLCRPARVLVAASLVSVAALLTGCTTFQAHEGDRTSAGLAIPIPDDQWPARKTDNLRELAAATPREIVSVISDGKPAQQVAPSNLDRAARDPGARAPFSGAYGKGVLRVAGPRRREWGGDGGGGGDARGSGSSSLRFYSVSTRDDRPVDPRLTEYAQRQAKMWEQRLASMDMGLKPNAPEILRMMADGTSIRITEPTGEIPARGTVVYMSGLGSIEYEQALVDELRHRGWWIVRIATPRVWWFESKPWYIGSKEDVPRIAQNLAGVLDDLVAEPAYAAEAALEYIEQHRPEVPLSPMVMVGCSAGALAAPTVVARMPEKFDAAILVGGGANLLEISQTSDLTDGGVKLAWPDNQPHGDWRKLLFKEYLEASKLDPFHTAKYLRDKPTLVVSANLDMTVPASNGWLLWDALGRPDRYVHVGEHRTLFLTLKGQSKRIADWLDAAMLHRTVHQPVAHDSSGSGGEGVGSVGGGTGSGGGAGASGGAASGAH